MKNHSPRIILISMALAFASPLTPVWAALGNSSEEAITQTYLTKSQLKNLGIRIKAEPSLDGDTDEVTFSLKLPPSYTGNALAIEGAIVSLEDSDHMASIGVRVVDTGRARSQGNLQPDTLTVSLDDLTDVWGESGTDINGDDREVLLGIFSSENDFEELNPSDRFFTKAIRFENTQEFLEKQLALCRGSDKAHIAKLLLELSQSSDGYSSGRRFKKSDYQAILSQAAIEEIEDIITEAESLTYQERTRIKALRSQLAQYAVSHKKDETYAQAVTDLITIEAELIQEAIANADIGETKKFERQVSGFRAEIKAFARSYRGNADAGDLAWDTYKELAAAHVNRPQATLRDFDQARKLLEKHAPKDLKLSTENKDDREVQLANLDIGEVTYLAMNDSSMQLFGAKHMALIQKLQGRAARVCSGMIQKDKKFLGIHYTSTKPNPEGIDYAKCSEATQKVTEAQALVQVAQKTMMDRQQAALKAEQERLNQINNAMNPNGSNTQAAAASIPGLPINQATLTAAPNVQTGSVITSMPVQQSVIFGSR